MRPRRTPARGMPLEFPVYVSVIFSATISPVPHDEYLSALHAPRVAPKISTAASFANFCI